MTTKNYTFESANKGEIYITIDGEYEYGTKDISIDVNGEDGTMIEDTDDAADVINWLIDNGVRFESKRSMFANLRYIQSVLIDGDMTPEQVWDEVAQLESDEQIDDLFQGCGVEVGDGVNDGHQMEEKETMTYANDHATRVKIVESGESYVFNNWHKHTGITMEDFLRELEWLDSDPCDGGRGDQMTREHGCTERDGLVRLKRVYGKLGFQGFYREDDGHRFIGKVSISCRDRV